MMQAYVFQVRNDFKASASKYSEVFQSLKEIFQILKIVLQNYEGI